MLLLDKLSSHRLVLVAIHFICLMAFGHLQIQWDGWDKTNGWPTQMVG